MPVWAWILTVVGLLIVLGALGVGGWFAWKAYERRALMKLMVRTAAIEAAAQALTDVVTRLSVAADEELESFAADADSPERRALHEVVSRASMIRDELDIMSLPKDLIPIAESMADAAHVIGVEAGAVEDDQREGDALDRLGTVDLAAVQSYTKQARAKVHAACLQFGLEETNVYGGGLYL